MFAIPDQMPMNRSPRCNEVNLQKSRNWRLTLFKKGLNKMCRVDQHPTRRNKRKSVVTEQQAAS